VPKLSVTVITKNEAANLAAALESVAWADEIVVVDAESHDETATIARRFTDRVVVRPWPGFPQQKNHAASLAAHDWILSIDADERVTPALGDEIRRLLAGTPAAPGYRIARVTIALGRAIRTTDWYPDWQLRLYDRRRARWDETRRLHEAVRVDGDAGRLSGELEHRAYRDLSHHLQTIDRYTTLAAEEMAAKGRRATLLEIAGHPPLAFLRNYVLRGGLRDGAVGLVISSMNAWYVFLKYAKLWELGRRDAGRDGRRPPSP
jgi:glycosyltransferase involved in cell wall biosynthesis